jgi:hypothetical protein
MSWEEAIKENVSGRKGLFLINVKYTMMTRALVDLLVHLLKEKRQSGVLISIDRPHTFVSKLMEKHEIPADGLVFVDAVTNISGEPTLSSDKLDLLASPFCINFLTGFVQCHASKLAASSSGFVLMDNLAALAPYMTESCIKRFLGILQSLDTECIIVLDKERHRFLFDILMTTGASEIQMAGGAISI